MKKKLLVIFFLASWIIFAVVYSLLCKFRGNEFSLLRKNIKAAIFTIRALFGSIIAACFSVISRSKYLKSNDITKPSFNVFCSTVVDVPQGFDFSRLKREIAGKWVITFSDDMEKVLKCRTNLNFFRKWDSAAWVKYDADAKKLYLECFPMIAGSMDKVARKMQKEIENCLKTT